MTWGQLRLQLQISAPGVPLDLLDEWLNTRYEQVLEATDWTGLKAHATIQTQAAYQSGTDKAAFTVGQVNVVGTGTAWSGTLIGQRMYRPGDTTIYTVAAVNSTTVLVLDRAYEGNGVDAAGTVYSGASYVFMQNVYPLPSDCRSIVTVLNPVTGLPMDSFTKDGLDASVGQRTAVNDPQAWAEYDDSTEFSPPVLHQIEFYPPPLRSRGFNLEYLRAANGFDGGNTSGAPLPFVSNTVLLAGARADINTHLENAAKAMKYEAEFERELSRLLLVEHSQRRVKAPVQMATRFTRHRLARATRGMRSGWGIGTGGPN